MSAALRFLLSFLAVVFGFAVGVLGAALAFVAVFILALGVTIWLTVLFTPASLAGASCPSADLRSACEVRPAPGGS